MNGVNVYIVEIDFKTRKGGVDMEFEELLKAHKRVVERFVFFKIADRQDAEDILQEVYLSHFKNLER